LFLISSLLQPFTLSFSKHLPSPSWIHYPSTFVPFFPHTFPLPNEQMGNWVYKHPLYYSTYSWNILRTSSGSQASKCGYNLINRYLDIDTLSRIRAESLQKSFFLFIPSAAYVNARSIFKFSTLDNKSVILQITREVRDWQYNTIPESTKAFRKN